MLIYSIEQYYGNKIFQVNYSNIFLNNNISFLKIFTFSRDGYYINFLGLIIPFLICIRLYYSNILSTFFIKNNQIIFILSYKIRLLNDNFYLLLIFFVSIILFFIADLGIINYLKSLIFSNIIFFYPLRTLDKLYSFVPFLFISIFIYRLKTINRNYVTLIFSILIFLSIIKSNYYFSHTFKEDGLSHSSYKLTSYFNDDYLEASKYINNNIGLSVFVNKRKSPDLMGWVEIQKEFILGKHPLINIVNESIVNIYDKNIIFNNVNHNLGSILENNLYEEFYIILRLMSIRNIVFDTVNLTDNNIILKKLKKLEDLDFVKLKFQNNSIIIYELNNFMQTNYTSTKSTKDIFSSPLSSLSSNYKNYNFKNCINYSCESENISNFVILSRTYSPFWTYGLSDNKLVRPYLSPLGNNEFFNKKGSAGSIIYLSNSIINFSIVTNILSIVLTISVLLISFRCIYQKTRSFSV
jgi:hypothetical protein